MSIEALSQPVQFTRGVGPQRAKLLAKMGIATVADLLYAFPLRYEDRSRVLTPADLLPGETVSVLGEVAGIGEVPLRGGRRIVEVHFTGGGRSVTGVWFRGNRVWLRQLFTKGRRFMVAGKVVLNERRHRLEITHPEVEEIEEGEETIHTGRIVPVHPGTEGLSRRWYRGFVHDLVEEHAGNLPEPLPASALARRRLPGISQALRGIHFPEGVPMESLMLHRSPAQRRFIYEEFYLMEVGLALMKRSSETKKGIAMNPGVALVRDYIEGLPFTPTEAQKRVVREILGDMARERPMGRLLQGEVGSGKTAVALGAICAAVGNGCQAAVMAPTEILAEQHYLTFRRLLKDLPINVALLTGGRKAAQKRDALAAIAAGEAQVVCGTQALIQEGVEYQRLGLVVIDEQHRFGVLQRGELMGKGEHPHTLVMTATPIPRSLALTLYGELDLSVMDELPPGRQPVKTLFFLEGNRQRAYEAVRKEVERGNQAFIVYPLVEESEKVPLRAATEMFEHFGRDIFPGIPLGLLHGRMAAEEKQAVMEAFSKGEVKILIATTVIEVGIDIPAATVMLIEHADRFGLAQLHQLRGRVGRGGQPSWCLLVGSERLGEEARRRLRTMVESSDGYRIAEEDLRLRGPGEFFGTRQSGIPELRAADLLRDRPILEDAREDAFALIEAGGRLPEPLREHLIMRWGDRLRYLLY
jgi:ATP-dependent DNA helicase RecG